MGRLMSPGDAAQFNIQIGNKLTHNVQPILHQIRHALEQLLDDHKTTTIDLRSIPLAPEEESTILDILGQGEVHARLNALGPSEIIETGCAGVWLVTHFNESSHTVSRFIEVTEMPDILKSQHRDIFNGLQMLNHKLETLAT